LTLVETNLPDETLKPKEDYETWDMEWRMCKKSPLYFLKMYCLLQDRALKATIKFEDWPYLVSLLNDFQIEKQIIILKARQLGISWLVAGYSLWLVLFHENAKVLLLSQGENEAGELLGKCRFIHNNLPPQLCGMRREPDQMGFIGFPSSGGEIRALPSTEKAGRSTDASLVVCDEWEFHPYAEQNYAAVKPTIDAEGSQFIGLSTADKTKTDTFFKQKYREALKGGNFKAIFLPWNLRPGRTEDWFKSLSNDLSQHQIEQEYPSTEREALETLASRPFFDSTTVEAMYADCLNPIEHEISDKYNTIKIFRLPEPGVLYATFTDPSYGRDDPHATIVIKTATGEQVAESHGKLPVERVGIVHDALVRLYNNAFNSFELNAEVGNLMRETLETLETPNQAPFIKPDGKTDLSKKGWWTGKQTKPKMLWGLEEAVRLRQIIPRSKECLDEFSHIWLPEGEEPQAPRGLHDDYTMAWAGVWQIKGYTPRKTGAGFKSWTRREITY